MSETSFSHTFYTKGYSTSSVSAIKKNQLPGKVLKFSFIHKSFSPIQKSR